MKTVPGILCLVLQRLLWIGLVAGGPVATVGSAAEEARTRTLFDAGWKFHRGDLPGAEQPGFDASGWTPVELPHDWSIQGPYDEQASSGGSGGYLPTGIGWYRKDFMLPETMRGRRVEILFDGVYQHSTVWLNGQRLGYRPFGYISFAYDLTPHLRFGSAPNELVVKVDNSPQPSSRWYSGSGIYRHVWLIATDPLHIPVWGTFVTTTSASPEHAALRVETKVRNGRAQAQDVELVSELVDGSGTTVARATLRRSIAAGATAEFGQDLEVASPQLWSPETPTLYDLRATVRADGTVVDTWVTRTGIRTIRFDPDKGFLLNDQPVKLRGMCLHHDGGGVGAAVPEGVWERRFRLLREMGANAVRCSHNPMAPEFYDLCDRLGILVMNEAFDEWTIRKPQIRHGYSDVFAEWHERDVVDLVHRDRNHPSVIMWSAGNEIGEQWAPEGPAIVRRLVELFHREDPTRPVTAAMDNIFNQRGQAPVEFSDALDIVGYNYVDRWGSRRETHHEDDRRAFPHRRFVGTENVSARGVRGEYRFGPLVGGGFRPGRPPERGVGPEGAWYLGDVIRAAELWKFVATRDWVIGDFAWTGFDYLGEARWPRKLAASGPLDTSGFKKDAFHFYQSLWTDAPMVHILPHWNWAGREGTMIPVVVYSNGDTVELFLNGRSLGAKAREFPRQGAEGGWNSYARPVVRSSTADLFLAWDVPYEPGEVKAVAWRQGRIVAEKVIRTAGPAAGLAVEVERGELTRGPREVLHVTVRAIDAAGTFAPLADDEVTFVISGPAKLIAVDNGDPTSHESYQGPARRLFHGMALAILQRTGDTGPVRIEARATGLASAQAEVMLHEP